MNKEESSEITLLRDREWSFIDGEACRVINFNPFCSFKDGKISPIGILPYASVTIESRKVNKIIKGFVTHKIDFIHLWTAFIERTIKENEEVIICWTKKHYKLKILRFFPTFLPKLIVMICQKGAFEFINYPNHKPEIQGEARYEMQKSIVQWKPEVME